MAEFGIACRLARSSLGWKHETTGPTRAGLMQGHCWWNYESIQDRRFRLFTGSSCLESSTAVSRDACAGYNTPTGIALDNSTNARRRGGIWLRARTYSTAARPLGSGSASGRYCNVKGKARLIRRSRAANQKRCRLRAYGDRRTATALGCVINSDAEADGGGTSDHHICWID